MTQRFNTSKLISGIAAAVFAVAVFAPAMASAEDTMTTHKSMDTNFCTRLTTLTDKIDSGLHQKEDGFAKARTDRQEKLSHHEEEWGKKVAEFRAKEDAKRAENFKAVEAKATTDAQKAAVATYEQAVKDAIATRRAAHDASQKAFVDAIQSFMANHRSTVDTQRAAFVAAVDAAIAKAKASCAAGTSAETIHTTLKADLEAARNTFKTDRQGDDKLKDEIKSLNDTRKAANKAANEAFQTAIKAARQTLLKAFTSEDI